MINELSRQIWENGNFQSDYHSLEIISAGYGLDLEKDSADEFDSSTVSRLVQSASALAASTSERHKQASYHIATMLWKCFSDELDNLYRPVSIILSRLGNFPSLDLLEQDLKTDPLLDIGNFTLRFEAALREENNTVETKGERLSLTDFQHRLWEALQSGSSVTISAPTSAGKSFILYRYLLSRLSREPSFTSVYIVPTRALISQVSYDLEKVIRDSKIRGATVSPVPVVHRSAERIIYVLTQERLQRLLQIAPKLQFDMLIADEAQSVQDGGRGIVFQDAVEGVIERSSDTQLVFAAPLASNPEVFSVIFKVTDLKPVMEENSPVSQNIFAVERVPKRHKRFRISLLARENSFVVGDLLVQNSFQGKPKTLANLAWELGDGDSSLVYYGKPASCERIAQYIGDIRSEYTKIDTDEEVHNFANFVENQIHPNYPLSDTLRRGVSFHYGNMPSAIRSGIEDLFKREKIDYLIATSTLLQGVNVPAKNIFMYKPVKGANIELSKSEFWNLAGRAGRLAKDFEGNVYLIDHSSWEENPLKGDKLEEITSSTDSLLNTRLDDLIDFAEQPNHGSDSNQAIENLFVKLFLAHRYENIDNIISKSIEDPDDEKVKQLTNAIDQASSDVSLPTHVIEENKSVSPRRLSSLFSFFDETIDSVGVETLIPPHPLSKDAYDRMKNVFRIIWRSLNKRKDNSYSYLTYIAYKWTRGKSYRYLIDDAIEYDDSNKRDSTIIRNLLSTLNKEVRYELVKLTRAYNSTLMYTITEKGLNIDRERISDLPLYLEIGASSETMVSLIEIGLSRLTASIVSELVPGDGFGPDRVRTWLMNNRSRLDLPSPCRNEVESLL